MIRAAVFRVPLAVLMALAAWGCAAPPGDSAPAPPENPAPAPATLPAPDFELGDEQTHNKFSSVIPPVLRVPSGAVVRVRTKEATDGQLRHGSPLEDLARVEFEPIHPLSGPIAVEGAEPGDVLAVTLLDFVVEGWGWTAITPGFGFLGPEFPDPWLRTFDIPPGATSVAFDERIELELAPFAGVMGVAPSTAELLSTIPPRANGGNMDDPHLVAGTTVYFPVFVSGANFSIGDTHALQGQGEVCGTALEAPMTILLRLELLKGARPIEEPQYETDDYYAVTGFGTTLDEAARKATRYMIDWLVAEHGLSREEAYALCSLAGDLKIAETVDVPHMLVAMHMPKRIFRAPKQPA